MPWDPTQNEDPDARRREQLRRQYERENPFRLPAQPTAPTCVRNRSPPVTLPPLRQRSPAREDSTAPELPSMSELWWLQPFQGVQPRESAIRSTLNRTPPEFAARHENTVRLQGPIVFSPIADLQPSDSLSIFSTPCHTQGEQGTPRQMSTSPTTTVSGPDNTAYEETDEVNGEDEGPANAQVGQDKDDAIICEFSGDIPCRMRSSPDDPPPRKVVSHIFGRNKASTRLFPTRIWIHYCRRHYQRARYRAEEWPFTQCELLLATVNRLEDWGGVQKFELILRRREKERVEKGAKPKKRPSSSGKLPSGRKQPTPIVSPVPDWLRQRCGEVMSFQDIRNLIEEIRDYLIHLREEEKAQNAKQDALLPITSTKPSRQSRSQVHFPDIEILPRFKEWVLKADLAKRAGRYQVPQRVQDMDDEEDEDEDEDEAPDYGGEIIDDDGRVVTPASEPPRVRTESNASPSGTLDAQSLRRSDRIPFRAALKESVRRVSAKGAVKKPRQKD